MSGISISQIDLCCETDHDKAPSSPLRIYAASFPESRRSARQRGTVFNLGTLPPRFSGGGSPTWHRKDGYRMRSRARAAIKQNRAVWVETTRSNTRDKPFIDARKTQKRFTARNTKERFHARTSQ